MTRAPAVPAAEANEALRVLVLAVVVTAIVVFDPRSDHAGGRPKYLVVVAGAVVAAILVAGAGRSGRPNPLRGPVVALLVGATVATIASDHGRTAVFGFAGSYDGLVTTVSFAVLFVAAARAFDTSSVRYGARLLWFGAGTVVLLFGVAQLLDRLVSPDTGWDWARPGIAPWTIGSTLGNPNHLGALLAMLLPLGAVFVVETRGRERALVLAGGGLAVVELGVTASRGAWMAAVVAGASMALVFRRRLRPHRRRLVLASAATAAVLAAALALGSAAGVTKATPATLVRTGPGSTLDLRMELWATAWRIGRDHPVLGVGPDVFPVVFPAYATERWMVLYGPFTVANGAHNLFLNTFVDLGAGGLAAFLAVLVAATALLVRTWPTVDAEARVLAAGLAAGILAYLVQACLNTQTVALTLTFWTLLGWLVAVLSGPAKEA